MARSAKTTDIEITERVANKLIGDILSKYADLETARGQFMNQARRIREGIQSVIDGAAARGIAPKITKLTIKIEQTQAKLQGLMAELDAEERKQLKKILVAHGNKAQLRLFDDLPEAVRPPPVVILSGGRTPKHPKDRKGVSGADLEKAAVEAGEPPSETLQ
jgi:hypothetical protein